MQRIQPITTKPKLILFCGLPGSGKTTLGRKLEKELPAIRLCPDEWIANLGINPFDEGIRTKLEIQLWKLGRELPRSGQNVILENGLWSHAERDEKRNDVAKLGIDIDTELHYFDVPFEELMRRLKVRNVSRDCTTVPLTRERMEDYAQHFQAPDETELSLFTNSVVHYAAGQERAYSSLAGKIKSLALPSNRPLIVAVSGFGGSGKTTLAKFLKAALENAKVVGIDSFSNHEWRRNTDWDNFDRSRFAKEILRPAHNNKFPLSYAHEPWPGCVEGPAIRVPTCRYLIVEGCSIFHPDLLSYYDYKIWVDSSLEEATKRAMWRDRYIHKNEQDYYWKNIWMPNECDFFVKYRPNQSADIILSTEEETYK